MQLVSDMIRDVDEDMGIPGSERGQPAWALATLLPAQGAWSEDDYFRLETEHFVELVDGCIEVLPMPTWLHQRIVRWLSRRLEDWTILHSHGEVLFAPLPLKLFVGTIREPDILIVQRRDQNSRLEKYPTSALMVVEVVSDGNTSRNRDMIDKRHDYAKAGIAEYWIVDPVDKVIIVLALDRNEYREHGCFVGDQIASSLLLTDFTISTNDVWALERDA